MNEKYFEAIEFLQDDATFHKARSYIRSRKSPTTHPQLGTLSMSIKVQDVTGRNADVLVIRATKEKENLLTDEQFERTLSALASEIHYDLITNTKNEQEIRKQNPAAQIAYDQYISVMRLCGYIEEK